MTDAKAGQPLLYITGWCRSGSTVLGNLLGELPGVIHVGELHYLWCNGILGKGTNTTCGCGATITECSLWRKVIDQVAADAPAGVAVGAVAGQRRYLRTRHTRARLAEATGHRPVSPAVAAALDLMINIYRAIADQTNARLIVDTSKYPAEAAALLGRSEVDLRVLHLVRDPRATAHSWRRAKAYIPAMGVARSTACWTAFNLASERVGRAAPERYLRLRYEDFAANPRAALSGIIELAGLADPPPVDESGQAMLGVNHTVTGNPDRLLRGPVRIHPDESWRAGLRAGQTMLATVLAAPALTRYGYPVMKGPPWIWE